MRITTTLVLLLTVSFCAEAQNPFSWSSARKSGLKGAVHTVESKCSDINGNYETRYKYEYARDGKLMTITGPYVELSDIIIGDVMEPITSKITKRNSRGEIEEVSSFIEGDLLGKEKYEREYDNVGNWIKRTDYQWVKFDSLDGRWKADEWRATYVCSRTIQYYQ
jgi:hypothetical protein